MLPKMDLVEVTQSALLFPQPSITPTPLHILREAVVGVVLGIPLLNQHITEEEAALAGAMEGREVRQWQGALEEE
jgi:hypothetical protein